MFKSFTGGFKQGYSGKDYKPCYDVKPSNIESSSKFKLFVRSLFTNKQKEYQNRLESAFAGMNNKSNNVSIIESSPIKLKKGESLLAYFDNTQMGTYKRNGTMVSHGVTARIRIAKGVSYRMGVGQLAMLKSWVFDELGTLYITTKGVFFNGSHANTFISYDNMMQCITPDGINLMVDKRSGKDVCFKLPTELDPKLAVIMYAYSMGGAA